MQYKFRGKIKDTGEWVYGSYIDFDLIHQIIPIGKSKAVIVLPSSVGMWTGLADKTTTNMYEGDIIRYTEYNSSGADIPNCVSVIKFDEGSFLPVSEGYCINTEIIGNTTDNPELLETEAQNE